MNLKNNTASDTSPSSRRQLRRQVLTLALPIITENFLLSMVEYVDTAMVGSLGPDATASVACTTPVMWVLNSLVTALSVGGTVAVAQSVGAGDFDKARRVCAQAFLSVAVLGTAIMAFLFFCSGQIPVFMGVDPEIYESATAYIAILALGMPFHCTSTVLYGIIRGAGDTKTPMCLNIFTNICNITGNFLLIFPSRMMTLGSFSLPVWGAGMGVAGAALSSTLARAVSCLILLKIMTRRTDVTLQLRGLRPDKAIISEILQIGLPTALERLAINGGHLLYARLVAGLGTITLAAHQLSQTAESICFMPAIGFETAATTLAGQSAGARQYKEARRRVWMTVELCTYYVVAASLLLFFGCGFLLGLLTPSAEVIAEGCKALRVAAFFETFYGIQAVFGGALRGVGATRQPLYIGLGSMWLLRIPLALLFVCRFGGGIASVWLAMGLDLVLRTVLMFWRFQKGNWEKKLRNKETQKGLTS